MWPNFGVRSNIRHIGSCYPSNVIIVIYNINTHCTFYAHCISISSFVAVVLEHDNSGRVLLIYV